MAGPNDFHLANGVMHPGLEPPHAAPVEAPKKRGPGRPPKDRPQHEPPASNAGVED